MWKCAVLFIIIEYLLSIEIIFVDREHILYIQSGTFFLLHCWQDNCNRNPLSPTHMLPLMMADGKHWVLWKITEYMAVSRFMLHTVGYGYHSFFFFNLPTGPSQLGNSSHYQKQLTCEFLRIIEEFWVCRIEPTLWIRVWPNRFFTSLPIIYILFETLHTKHYFFVIWAMRSIFNTVLPGRNASSMLWHQGAKLGKSLGFPFGNSPLKIGFPTEFLGVPETWKLSNFAPCDTII